MVMEVLWWAKSVFSILVTINPCFKPIYEAKPRNSQLCYSCFQNFWWKKELYSPAAVRYPKTKRCKCQPRKRQYQKEVVNQINSFYLAGFYFGEHNPYFQKLLYWLL